MVGNPDTPNLDVTSHKSQGTSHKMGRCSGTTCGGEPRHAEPGRTGHKSQAQVTRWEGAVEPLVVGNPRHAEPGRHKSQVTGHKSQDGKVQWNHLWWGTQTRRTWTSQSQVTGHKSQDGKVQWNHLWWGTQTRRTWTSQVTSHRAQVTRWEGAVEPLGGGEPRTRRTWTGEAHVTGNQMTRCTRKVHMQSVHLSTFPNTPTGTAVPLLVLHTHFSPSSLWLSASHFGNHHVALALEHIPQRLVGLPEQQGTASRKHKEHKGEATVRPKWLCKADTWQQRHIGSLL